MSITYCSLIAISSHILLSESTKSESYNKRIKNLFSKILKKNICDTIEIEGDQIVTFLRTKKILFICVSDIKQGEERPRRFIEKLATMVIKEFDGIDNIIPLEHVNHLCLHTKLESKLNHILEDYETGLYTNKEHITNINKDLEEMKQNMNSNIKKLVSNTNELDELLIITKKINDKAHDYKENAKELELQTRCIKPWMVILFIVIMVSFVVYTIFALYLCGNMSLFCEKKKFPR